MLALERQKKILEFLNSDGVVSVSRLSAELGVTEETVRRDLEKLEKQEALRRTHGGAVPLEGTTYEISLEKRKNINVDAKIKLAKEAVKYVTAGDTIFLDASTTTFFMAKELKNRKNITVITNSLRVAVELSGCENIKVISVGGVLSNNQSFVGRHAEKSIEENYFASKIFFSSKGITADGGILESNEAECGIKHKMLANAREKYYLCDKSKMGGVGFVKLVPMNEVDYIVTEVEPDEKLQEKLDENEVKVIKISE
ncbi:MAG: DeoR/GlpR transcriptional regulator [Clostridia bacterium]|nr:DeoR/GlpR transcriptional regulator [Oscillospiraceae bacterium]MBQ7959661.1 DeoR/GlpR transcriptional regulator [Clostridia bacterium]